MKLAQWDPNNFVLNFVRFQCVDFRDAGKIVVKIHRVRMPAFYGGPIRWGPVMGGPIKGGPTRVAL